MTTTQQQAIITLLDKKGKDRSKIENWRPISLLNVDYKIATKVISNRLIPLLPNLVSIDQTGFVKNRLLGDTVRTIQDLIDYCNGNSLNGLMLFIDFEKAYDSIEWSYLIHVLHEMNFGNDLIRWVKTFYYDISSCILNNGVTSTYFKISRGLRQGDPLSSYLFILAVEVLSENIRKSKNISGIKLKGKEIKILQYADDTTLILKDEISLRTPYKLYLHLKKYQD